MKTYNALFRTVVAPHFGLDSSPHVYHIFSVHNYVKNSFITPRKNTYDIGKVIGLKRYADGNSVGRRNDNPILETGKYRVEFNYGEVIKLTANVIIESIYAACDDSGNEYLMMESIVDYWNNDKSVTVPYQKVVHKGQSFMKRSTAG